MKKLSGLIAFFVSSIFAQFPPSNYAVGFPIHAINIDSVIDSNGAQSKAYLASGNQITANFIGDSYSSIACCGAPDPNVPWVKPFATEMGLNIGITGEGGTLVEDPSQIGRADSIAVGQTNLSWKVDGGNDMRTGIPQAQYSAALSYLIAKVGVPDAMKADSFSCAGGPCSTVPFYASNFTMVQNAGDFYTFGTYGSAIVVYGLMDTAGGQLKVTVDGVRRGYLNEHMTNVTPAYLDGAQTKSPAAFVISGLSDGPHTVVLTDSTSRKVYLGQFFGGDPSRILNPLVFMGGGNVLKASVYAGIPPPYDHGSKSAAIAFGHYQDSIASALQLVGIQVHYITLSLDTNTDYQSDGVHPNATGAEKIASQFETVFQQFATVQKGLNIALAPKNNLAVGAPRAMQIQEIPISYTPTQIQLIAPPPGTNFSFPMFSMMSHQCGDLQQTGVFNMGSAGALPDTVLKDGFVIRTNNMGSSSCDSANLKTTFATRKNGHEHTTLTLWNSGDWVFGDKDTIAGDDPRYQVNVHGDRGMQSDAGFVSDNGGFRSNQDAALNILANLNLTGTTGTLAFSPTRFFNTVRMDSTITISNLTGGSLLGLDNFNHAITTGTSGIVAKIADSLIHDSLTSGNGIWSAARIDGDTVVVADQFKLLYPTTGYLHIDGSGIVNSIDSSTAFSNLTNYSVRGRFASMHLAGNDTIHGSLTDSGAASIVGVLGVGISNPSSPLFSSDIAEFFYPSTYNVTMGSWGGNQNRGILFVAGGGTYAAQTQLLAGRQIGRLAVNGDTGTSNVMAGNQTLQSYLAAGNWSTTNRGISQQFFSTDSGATTSTFAGEIHNHHFNWGTNIDNSSYIAHFATKPVLFDSSPTVSGLAHGAVDSCLHATSGGQFALGCPGGGGGGITGILNPGASLIATGVNTVAAGKIFEDTANLIIDVGENILRFPPAGGSIMPQPAEGQPGDMKFCGGYTVSNDKYCEVSEGAFIQVLGVDAYDAGANDGGSIHMRLGNVSNNGNFKLYDEYNDGDPIENYEQVDRSWYYKGNTYDFATGSNDGLLHMAASTGLVEIEANNFQIDQDIIWTGGGASSGRVAYDGTTHALSVAASNLDTSGSFTATLTGVSGTVTKSIPFRVANGIVSLTIPDSLFTGTSNSTSMTFTGLPAGLRPPTTQQHVNCLVYTTATTEVPGQAIISVGSGTVVFTAMTSFGALFSSTGWAATIVTKGVPYQILTWNLN